MGVARKRSTRNHYDELGGDVYNAQYGDEQPPKYHLALRLAPPSRDGLLLDDGCGTGTFLPDLGERGVGLDLSSSLLSTARWKLRGRSHLVQGDAEALPFRDTVFAGIYSFTIVQNTPDPIEALAEMVRVVRGSSWVIVTAIRKAFTLKSFEGLMRSQKWGELHFSDADPHDLVAYARSNER